MNTSDLRPVHPEDYPAIRTLLIEEGLPNGDIAIGQASRSHLVVQDGEFLACTGLELYGSDVLLRSVVVAKCARQNGLDRALAGIAERDALAIGISRLFLLTMTAAGYFTALGYERFDRRLASGSFQSSSQFSLLCPVSAMCMTKNLPQSRENACLRRDDLKGADRLVAQSYGMGATSAAQVTAALGFAMAGLIHPTQS